MTRPITHVETNAQLRTLVRQAISEHGPGVNLNHLDVSGMKHFDNVFKELSFSGDVSKWNMAQTVSICNMFQDCELSADLSAWRFEVALSRTRPFPILFISARGIRQRW